MMIQGITEMRETLLYDMMGYTQVKELKTLHEDSKDREISDQSLVINVVVVEGMVIVVLDEKG